MIILDELKNRNILNDLFLRELLLDLQDGKYQSLDEAIFSKGISYVDIRKIRSEIYEIEEYRQNILVDQSLLKYLNEETIRRYEVLPISLRDFLLVGVVDPEKDDCLDIIQERMSNTGVPYKIVLIAYDQYKSALDSLVARGVDVGTQVLENIVTKISSAPQGGDDSKDNAPEVHLDEIFKVSDKNKSPAFSKDADARKRFEVEEISDISNVSSVLDENSINQPVEDLVNSIVKNAIDIGTSDIHIERMDGKMRVRFRIDGELRPVLDIPGDIADQLTARIKIITNMKLDEKRKPQDGRFSVRLDGHKVDFRASILPSYYGEKVVIRILDSYRGVKPLKDIGFSEQHLSEIRKALERPFGLILISGPTGSGKTTTLYSMLNEVDRKTKNVISLEDPVEYNLEDITQSQIFPEIGYTFASGLRSILRQDPDVIMVGEIRDAETAQLAIQAALTGHLVFSTIHTNSSLGVIPRLIDMGVDPYLIAPTLCLAIAQRLVRRIVPSSRSPMEMTVGLKAFVNESFADLNKDVVAGLSLDRPLYEAVPSEMSPTGLKGRAPIVEVVSIDNDFQEAILKRQTEEDLVKIAKSKGILNMKNDAILKCMDGIVPFVEISNL
jgi:type IV pilus assembly protein PilB